MQTDRLLNTALHSLLSGLSKSDNGQFLIDCEQVRSWNDCILSQFVKADIVIAYEPDITMICPGCEDACSMPVQIGNGIKQPFIVCEHKDYIGRIPVNPENLRRWVFSFYGLSRILSSLITGAFSSRTIISERLFYAGQAHTLSGETDIFLLQTLDDASHAEIKQSVRYILLTLNEVMKTDLPAIALRRVLSFKNGALFLNIDVMNKVLASQCPASYENIFRCDGETWTVQFQGQSCSIKNTNGMVLLAHLLSHPERLFHVFELEQLLGNAAVLESSLIGSSADTAPIRTKLHELQEHIEDAQEKGNIEKTEALKDERDTILKSLQAQTGIDGKPRPANDSGNKARDRIQKAIRTAKNNIKSAGHKSLFNHLENSIVTGFSCSYQPPTKIFWKNFSDTKR